MSDGITYGINFPFRESFVGRYLDISNSGSEEIRSNLIHLLLTRKGSRYYLPDFGTRLYEFIFDPLDGPTFGEIDSEIREVVDKYMPNILINNIKIYDASEDDLNKGSFINSEDNREFTVPDIGRKEHTAKVRIDYQVNNQVFNSSDFIIINL